MVSRVAQLDTQGLLPRSLSLNAFSLLLGPRGGMTGWGPRGRLLVLREVEAAAKAISIAGVCREMQTC